MKRRTARQIYIAMLRNRCQSIDTMPPAERETWLWAELIKAGYLKGITQTNQEGLPSGNIIEGPTVEGRLFLQELEVEEEKDSFRSKALRYGIPAVTFIGGILASILIDWLKKKLGV